MSDDESSGNHMMTSEVARMAGVSGAAIRAAVADGRIKPAHTTKSGVHIFHYEEAVRYTAARQEYAKLTNSARNVWRAGE